MKIGKCGVEWNVERAWLKNLQLAFVSGCRGEGRLFFFFSHKLQRLARGIKNNKKYLLMFILLGWSVIGQNL